MTTSETWKVLGTGGRDWPRTEAGLRTIRSVLRRIALTHPNKRLILVHGDCPRGADAIMNDIGPEVGFEVRPYPVNHELDGPWPAAGPRRNMRMLGAENRNGEPVNEGIAFPSEGSRGTWDMLRRLEHASIPGSIHYLEAAR